MKLAALHPGIGIAAGLAVGSACLGLAPPALAHGNDCSVCVQAMGDEDYGGGGGRRMDRRMMRAAHGGGHKHFNLVVQPYWNLNSDQIFTLLGLEMVKQDSLGWKGGLGMYSGMNLGISTQTNTFSYGGVIFGKDWTAGPLSLTSGVLLGFGRTANILPDVLPSGISNFYMFGVAAPRLGLAWTVYDRMEIGVDASYLFTTQAGVGHSPAVSLRLSTISWGRRGH